ncbi:MAG: TrbG/VirB9 family P-type conjugative transfer protein [Proteobacteria bacterium]|nr:TrbG/VirB9 family P-type conjugative transfer protein [Pseudomonadota bacterium]
MLNYARLHKTGVYAHVELKPVSNNLESNLIIFTDKRNYVMTVKSSKSKKYFSRVAFNYEDEPANKKISVVYSSIPARSKYDYRIRGDRMPWTPLQILTDGKKTYIELPKQYYHSKDMPVLHALDDDGVSSIINTRQFQNYLIVDVMLDKGELVQNVGNNQKKIIFTRSGTIGVISKIFN